MRWPLPFVLPLCLTAPLALAKAPAGAWGVPEIIGKITADHLPEASGIALSHANPERLYHINDAGSSPSLVVTDRDGSHARTVTLNIDHVTDTEDLAVGPCPDRGSCLFIGDIGDNKARRPFVTLHVVRDTPDLGTSVTPVFSANLTYDDGKAHNAESLAIHPDGYGYILTKESPAVFFRFAIASLTTDSEITLEKVGSLDISPWLAGTDKPTKIIPTSIDIRPDGGQIVILTRAAGLSMNIDLEQAFRSQFTDLNRILEEQGIEPQALPMMKLPQTEAVTYVDGGRGIVYTSEIIEAGGSSSPLVKIPALASGT